MEKDPANVTRWKHEFGFHNRGVVDIPKSKRAGEGKDGLQFMARGRHFEEDAAKQEKEEV